MTAVPMTTIVSKSWSIFFFSNLLLLLCKIWIDARIDELVGEWTSKLLGAPLTAEEQIDLVSVPVVSGENGPRPKLVNRFFAGYNFTGLAGNGPITRRAIETLWKYGVGSCGLT